MHMARRKQWEYSPAKGEIIRRNHLLPQFSCGAVWRMGRATSQHQTMTELSISTTSHSDPKRRIRNVVAPELNALPTVIPPVS